jgi:hypothetical protein
VIFPGLGLGLIVAFWAKRPAKEGFWRNLSTNTFARNFGVSVALALGIIGFYAMTSSKATTNLAQADYSAANIKTYFSDLSYLLDKTGLLIKETFWLLLLICPWPILLIVQRIPSSDRWHPARWVGHLRRWSHFHLLFLFLLILLTGLIASAYLSFNRYSFVFYRIMGIPILYLLVVWAVLLAIKNCRYYWLRVVCIAFVMVHGCLSALNVLHFDNSRKKFMIELYSGQYLQTVTQLVAQMPSPKGAYLKSNQIDDYPIAYTHTDYNQVLNPVFYHLGQYLTFVNAEATVSLIGNLYDLTDENGTLMGTSRESLPFLHFYKYIAKQDTAKANVDTQIRFIREQKIQFLILSKHILLDEKIKQLIQKEVTDATSGERFILLKPAS